MTEQLLTQYRRATPRHPLNLDVFLFWGFVGTLIQAVLPRNDIYVDIFLFSDTKIMIASVFWILFINVYIAILFNCIFLTTGVIEYKLISGFYLFSIFEFLLLYDKAWFYLFSLPVYSDTFIIFTFFYIFLKRNHA